MDVAVLMSVSHRRAVATVPGKRDPKEEGNESDHRAKEGGLRALESKNHQADHVVVELVLRNQYRSKCWRPEHQQPDAMRAA